MVDIDQSPMVMFCFSGGEMRNTRVWDAGINGGPHHALHHPEEQQHGKGRRDAAQNGGDAEAQPADEKDAHCAETVRQPAGEAAQTIASATA